MSRPSLPFDLVDDHIHITRWDDPLVDTNGHDPRSPYVERFWLSLLGPSTTFLARRIATELDAHPAGFDLHLEDTARALGLSGRGDTRSPFYRALARLGQFHITRATGPMALAARVRLQTLTRHQVERLSPSLRDEHATWLHTSVAEPTVEQRRTRARRLALSLLELGETAEATEQQLHRWKIHPAMAHEALRWAATRHGSMPPGASGAPGSAMAPGSASAATTAAAAGRPPTSGAPLPPPPVRTRPRTVFDPADDAA